MTENPGVRDYLLYMHGARFGKTAQVRAENRRNAVVVLCSMSAEDARMAIKLDNDAIRFMPILAER